MTRALLLALALAACGDDDGGEMPGRFPATLAEWNLFADAPAQVPADGVVPYQVIASLWADYAAKHRFISLPAGTTITYDPLEKWGFPVGAVLVKTFAYDARLLETRLLVREASGWTPITYVWNEAQTEARLTVAGARIPVSFMDLEYRVPNTNQCLGCHGDTGVTDLLGPRTRQLDRDGQLEDFAARGMFDRAPEPAAERFRLVDPLGPATVVERARSYLDANCGHCHNPTAAAQSTGLRLNIEASTPEDLGICRMPFSAGEGTGGRLFDVVPGHPEE